MNAVNQELLQGYSTEEKQAYIGAIASIATVDRKTTQDELAYLLAIAESAHVDETYIASCANDETNELLKSNLDILKSSDLRFALITDILLFAKSDGQLSQDEHNKINEISAYLNISPQQSTAINTLVDDTQSATSANEPVDESFLEKHGLSGMLKNANIPTSSILKGLLGIAAPIIIGKLLKNRTNGNNQIGNSGGAGLLGSLIGSGLGGGLLGSLLGGGNNRNSGNSQSTGGLGSILSNLSGGKGYGGLGSILKNIIQRR